jgi:hypothetical protein
MSARSFQQAKREAAAVEGGHTPGPWFADLNCPTMPGHIIKTIADPQRPVAALWEGGGTRGKPTQIANAHLIAAAPELLEMLEAILDDDGNMLWPFDRAKAAHLVEKAKGEA